MGQEARPGCRKGGERREGRETRPKRIERSFLFLIKHKGMKTKELGEGFKKRSDKIQWSLRRTPIKRLRRDSLRLLR